jgi:hypothetical protein
MPAGHASKNHHSAELLEAQQRLLELRQALPSRPRRQSRPKTPLEPAQNQVSQKIANAQKELERRRQLAGVKTTKPAEPGPISLKFSHSPTENRPRSRLPKVSDTVAVYPSMLLAMLKQDQAAAGRVYLLLRHLDTTGRGWLPVQEIRERLTRKGSPLKVMGWRRLRQIFNQGEGIFWERDAQGRLWLKSAAKIALKLECRRFKGNRVDLPIKTLLAGIGTVRAHFYACFHSGRSSENPISRETLESMTGLSPRTQREYDRLAQVKRQQNIAVGPRYNKITAEGQSWKRGRAVFTFIDSQGKQGPKNREYIAWRLPNSYQAPHQKRSKGRQKKINQQLVSLVKNGVQGNDHVEADKLFWTNGAAAGKAYSRDQELDAYWPRGSAQRRPGAIWYVMVGKEK